MNAAGSQIRRIGMVAEQNMYSGSPEKMSGVGLGVGVGVGVADQSNNMTTRRKFVEDVYGKTGAGEALSGGGGYAQPQRRVADPNASSTANANYAEPNSQRITPSAAMSGAAKSAALIQREALEQQINEKKRLKEAAKEKERLEEAEDMRKIELEAEKVKEEEAVAKRKKQSEEQAMLDHLQSVQETAAMKRRNGVANSQNSPPPPQVVRAPPAVKVAGAGAGAVAGAVAVRPPPKVSFPTASPKPSSNERPRPSPTKYNEFASPPLKVDYKTGPPKPGDFFNLQVEEERAGIKSPFSEQMVMLRASIEEENAPLQDVQSQFRSQLAGNRERSYANQFQPHTRSGGDIDLEQSLAGDTIFQIVTKDANAPLFPPTRLDQQAQQQHTNCVGASKNPTDENDQFIENWQRQNGFLPKTGAYAPARALVSQAQADLSMPNFRALNQLTSTRNFLTGDSSGMQGMERVTVEEAFTGEVLVEQSLRSESLLQYIEEAKLTAREMEGKSALQEIDETIATGNGENDDYFTQPRSVAVAVAATAVAVAVAVTPSSALKNSSRFESIAGPPVRELELEEEEDHLENALTETEEEEEEEIRVIPASEAAAAYTATLDENRGSAFQVHSPTENERKQMLDVQRSGWEAPESDLAKVSLAEKIRSNAGSRESYGGYENDDYEEEEEEEGGEEEEDLPPPQSPAEEILISTSPAAEMVKTVPFEFDAEIDFDEVKTNFEASQSFVAGEVEEEEEEEGEEEEDVVLVDDETVADEVSSEEEEEEEEEEEMEPPNLPTKKPLKNVEDEFATQLNEAASQINQDISIALERVKKSMDGSVEII